MLASRTTRPHFSISAATKTRNSCGVFSRNSTLSCLRRATISGCRSTAFKPALSLSTISFGVPAGTNTPFPFVCLESRQRFRHRRHVGKRRKAASARMRDAFERSRLDVPDRSGGVGELELHLPADEIVKHWPAAAVGDVIELDAGAMLEHFEREVLHRAVAR